MEDALTQLGEEVAQQLAVELAGRTYGACEGVTLSEIAAGESAGEPHYQLSWEVRTLGGVSTLKAVVLPDFLEMEQELLVSQLVALLAGRFQDEQQE